MIGTLLRINWLNLKRDRVALALTFLLPIGFFSIFALVFGGMSTGNIGKGAGGSGVRVLLVDEDGSDASQRVAQSLAKQDGLSVSFAPRTADKQTTSKPWTRAVAVHLVRTGKVPTAVILPAGFGESFGSFQAESPTVELIYDAANPIAQFTVAGLLQASSFQAAPDLLLESGLNTLAQAGGGAFTPNQRKTMERLKPFLRQQAMGEDADVPAGLDSSGAGAPTIGALQGLISVKATAAQAAEEDEDVPPDMVAYYAAAIGVMFLLFSMVGAAGSILEQEEFGTLERLLTSNLGMTRLLLSNWIFFTLLGIAQLSLMFLWASAVFGLKIFEVQTLVGASAMTIVTAAAGAAFGIMLATICRSRNQLSGVSTIVILAMSALGGSMIPKFMAPFLETTSRYTFNGWALDGYLNVFWYRAAGSGVGDVMVSILPHMGVIAAAALAFLVVARLAARRWERA